MRNMILRFAVVLVLYSLAMSVQAGHLFTQNNLNTPINLTAGNGVQLRQLATESNAGNAGRVDLYFNGDWSAGDSLLLTYQNYSQTFSFDNPLAGTSQGTGNISVTSDPALVAANIDANQVNPGINDSPLVAPELWTVQALSGDFTFTGYRIYTGNETIDGTNSDVITQDDVVPSNELGGGGGGVFMPVSNSVSSGTAEMLDSLVGTTGELGTVVTALSTMSEAERTAVQQRIAPQTSQALTAAASQTMEGPLDAIRIRLDNIRVGSNYQYQLAEQDNHHNQLALVDEHGERFAHDVEHDEETGISSGDTLFDKKSVWLKAFGARADQDGRRGYAGFDSQVSGLMLAADTELESGWVTGVGITYAETDVDMNDFRRGDNADINTYQLTAYAAKGFDTWYMENMLSYAYQQYDTERDTTVTGVADGDFDGYQIAARTMVGKPYHLDTEGVNVITPFASLQYNHLSQESYDEDGAGVLSLSIDSESVDRLKSEIGIEYDSIYRLKNGTLLQPSLRMGWRHEFDDSGVDATASFVGGSGEFFTEGQNINDDTYFVGAGLKYQTGPRTSFHVRIDGEASNGYSSYSGQTMGVINF